MSRVGVPTDVSSPGASRPAAGEFRGLLPLAALVAGYLLYAAWFVGRSTSVVDGVRFSSLNDEAMISMQYARNLVEGRGLVWMPGGPTVEGFASPLLVAWMALFHLLPIPTPELSLYVQAGSALIMGLNVVMLYLLAQEFVGRPSVAPLLAAGMTAFYLPLNLWGLTGTEVGPLLLAVSSSLWLTLRALNRQRFSPWPYILLSLALWIRLDAVALFLVVWAYQVIVDRNHRTQHLVWGGTLLAMTLTTQTGWRLWIFGDALPAAYRLKLVGVPLVGRWLRGLQVTLYFLYVSNWALLLFPFLLLLLERPRHWGLVGGLVLGIAALNAYNGGDSTDHLGGSNRYTSLAMPLYFVAFAWAVDHLGRVLRRPPALAKRWGGAVTPLILLSASVSALLTLHGVRGEDPSDARLLGAGPTFASTHRNVTLALFLQQIASGEATVAVVEAGAIPYFSGRGAIDLLGRSDPAILQGEARLDPNPFLGEVRQGFMKYDYAWSIEELRPDVVLELVPGTAADAQAFLNAYANVFVPELEAIVPDGHIYLRIGSPNVRWDIVESAATSLEGEVP